jgi:hypothetical protein
MTSSYLLVTTTKRRLSAGTTNGRRAGCGAPPTGGFGQ